MGRWFYERSLEAMTGKDAASPPAWDDEDTPEWTDDQLARAELAVGGKVVRPADGTLTRAGRMPLGECGEAAGDVAV